MLYFTLLTGGRRVASSLLTRVKVKWQAQGWRCWQGCWRIPQPASLHPPGLRERRTPKLPPGSATTQLILLKH